jgi:hypothetical protein
MKAISYNTKDSLIAHQLAVRDHDWDFLAYQLDLAVRAEVGHVVERDGAINKAKDFMVDGRWVPTSREGGGRRGDTRGVGGNGLLDEVVKGWILDDVGDYPQAEPPSVSVGSV